MRVRAMGGTGFGVAEQEGRPAVNLSRPDGREGFSIAWAGDPLTSKKNSNSVSQRHVLVIRL